jgi:hypothetical protein
MTIVIYANDGHSIMLRKWLSGVCVCFECLLER